MFASWCVWSAGLAKNVQRHGHGQTSSHFGGKVPSFVHFYAIATLWRCDKEGRVAGPVGGASTCAEREGALLSVGNRRRMV